ncbi:type II toxin-antitoxin system VapC family toxin [Sinomonas sp. ASV322]|uniref:type II toxin-antitoxin system VapC family toxin n=1 Tax=Sinomonas sp. ASV322 TaxID=3041920 RepID=UPI0027DBE72C|nr:type II toxin-antitoxin system VapC family toxin [Sinomonas sp. ASV322]MDQ4502493.1 type II toxin-antitoxin system VapC family toxin [Sinomonas sp. ASV322]
MGRTPYLLDTHTLVWALTEPRRLSRRARAALESWDSKLIASAVSGFELANKRRIGKLADLDGLLTGYEKHVLALVSEELPITAGHALEAGRLAWDHRDPFDRIIAAQALVEGYTLVTADSAFSALPGLDILW